MALDDRSMLPTILIQDLFSWRFPLVLGEYLDDNHVSID
jgi:hypothetical protein